jgi:hypothetical protein
MSSWGADTTDALVRALEASGAPVVGAGAAGMDGDLALATAPTGLTGRRFEIGSKAVRQAFTPAAGGGS